MSKKILSIEEFQKRKQELEMMRAASEFSDLMAEISDISMELLALLREIGADSVRVFADGDLEIHFPEDLGFDEAAQQNTEDKEDN